MQAFYRKRLKLYLNTLSKKMGVIFYIIYGLENNIVKI